MQDDFGNDVSWFQVEKIEEERQDSELLDTPDKSRATVISVQTD